MFDSWANELKPKRPDVSAPTWESFKKSMYGGEFLFNVSRELRLSLSDAAAGVAGQ